MKIGRIAFEMLKAIGLYRWKYNIRMHLKEIDVNARNWMVSDRIIESSRERENEPRVS